MVQIGYILDRTKVTGKTETNLITPSGSKYLLEDADWGFLHQIHVDECLAGRNDFYLIEQKTTVFNLFLDFDFKQEDPIHPELITLILNQIQDTIILMFSFRTEIITSKNTSSNNLHFNLPDIHVTNETAMNVRNKLVEKLYFIVDADWHKIVDAAVLKSKNTGLRMLGCPKIEKGSMKKLDNGYRVIEWEEEIRYLPVSIEHMTKTMIRYNGKETPCKQVITMKLDSKINTDPSLVEKIRSYITHPHKFNQKTNNMTYIFRNDGPRECMVMKGKVHKNNNFYVKKNMSNEFHYYCLHDECLSLGPCFLFQTIIDNDFEKQKIVEIAKDNTGKEYAEFHQEFLSYMNNYFSYILKQDCFMESRDGELFWYKSLVNRLNFKVACDVKGVDKAKNEIIESQKLSPGDIFKNSAFRREYNNVVFESYLSEKIKTSLNYNLFTGFEHNYRPEFQVDVERIQPILNHISKVWCTDNEELTHWLLCWYADLIQNPGELSGIALVIKGKPGAGKGSLCNFLGNKVVGKKYYSSVNEINQLLGQFNSKLMNKLLILCDEVANFGGAITNNNKLKGIITEPTQSIEMKFKEPMDVKNCCRLVFLTNNDWPVKVENNDRRYLCLETNNIYIGDGDYFRELYKHFDDLTAEHMFHFLAEYDISKWNKHKIPMTKFRRELMKKDLPTSIQFMIDEDESGSIKNEIFIYSFYEKYCTWFSNSQKTDHKKQTLMDFIEKICETFDARLVIRRDTDNDFEDNDGVFKFNGLLGNTFVFKDLDTFAKKIERNFGYGPDIGV